MKRWSKQRSSEIHGQRVRSRSNTPNALLQFAGSLGTERYREEMCGSEREGERERASDFQTVGYFLHSLQGGGVGVTLVRCFAKKTSWPKSSSHSCWVVAQAWQETPLSLNPSARDVFDTSETWKTKVHKYKRLQGNDSFTFSFGASSLL